MAFCKYGQTTGYREPSVELDPLVFELRKRRFDAGLSALGLADRMGYSADAIRRWESGVGFPTYRALLDWCQALGVGLTIQERGNE